MGFTATSAKDQSSQQSLCVRSRNARLLRVVIATSSDKTPENAGLKAPRLETFLGPGARRARSRQTGNLPGDRARRRPDSPPDSPIPSLYLEAL